VSFRYVFIGLSLRTSWGNDHATPYRALLQELARRGHDIVFLERESDEHEAHADLGTVPWAKTFTYGSLTELFDRFGSIVRESDLLVVGSHVVDGQSVARWALELLPTRVAFYDLDTPATLATLADGTCDYLAPELVSRFALYLSFGGGPLLDVLRRTYGAQWVRPLQCAVDPKVHFPEDTSTRWDLGCLGTYSRERQPTLERLLVEPARLWPEGRFAVAGAKYPADIEWPQNLEVEGHLPAALHRRFYSAQRFTLNVTHRRVAGSGWSPSVRLFEAAACGAPIISEPWPGLDELLVPGDEVLVVRTAIEALRLIRELPEAHRIKVAQAARKRVLSEHTSRHRAETLERYTRELLERRARRSRVAFTIDPRGEP
jgi:spore maturation protein CgeB